MLIFASNAGIWFGFIIQTFMSYSEQIQANILLLMLCLFIFSFNCFIFHETHDPLFHQQNDNMLFDNGSKNSVSIDICLEKQSSN